MHRLLVLTCLLGVATALGRSWPWMQGSGYRSHKTNADAVKEIKDELFSVAQKMQRFCRAHSDRTFKQAYSRRHYTLSIDMTGCSEEGLTVRAGQRLIVLQVRNSRCNFIALQLLPDVVDANSAFWRFEKEHLTVYFPYELDLGSCGRAVSDNVHSLPKFDNDTDNPDVDVKSDVDTSIFERRPRDRSLAKMRKERTSWEDLTN